MPTTIRLSEADRARVRHHLGYQNVEPVSSIALGFPSAQQPQFLVERAMDRLMPEGVGRIIQTLNALDCIEGQMIDALCRLSAQQLGELKLRNSNEEPTEQDLLEREYLRWAKRLADDLGAPLNPFSERFRTSGSGSSLNIPVALEG
jgi:hypothetical protein